MAETSAGREVFTDEDSGENYSEKTITFETEYGWINMPTVDVEGNQMSQEELEEFVAENGPIDPVTGEELSVYEDVDSAVAAAERRTEDLSNELEATGMYHGGTPCDILSTPDNIIGFDPVSGNPIPAGSNAINVRDDIPAVLSEGEYVVPADVVRYHGLKTFMQLRDEAKMGLMAMQMEGQIKSLEEEQGEEEGEAYETVECSECEGTGEIDGKECEHCEGYGYHYSDEQDEEEPDSESSEDAEVQAEGSDAEEGEREFQEEYETPEGNRVETPVTEIVEEFMAPDDVESEEEEDFYPTTEGQFAYKPTVKFAVMRMK